MVLGPLNLQPSEPVKIAVIIILARYFAHNAQKTGLTLRELLTPMVLVSIPFFLWPPSLIWEPPEPSS
ncbi:MAG: FtsW/RodA/SpoVE family cell cycle protein [Desulfobacterales bacterium]